MRESDTIIIGRVKSIESRWNNEHTMIYTYIDIFTIDFLKGRSNGSAVTIKLFGGTVDSIVTFMTGAPRFSRNEETLLFLRTVPQGPLANYPTVTGWAQGKFDIHTTPGTNSKTVTRDVSGIELVGGRQNQFLEEPISLEELTEMIQNELNK